MPQLKPSIDWFRNTHLPAPSKEPVRIDISDVTLENERMEAETNQRLQDIHLQQHRAFLDQQEELKVVRKNVHDYQRYKSVLTPGNREKNSCSMLVRRSRSYNYINEAKLQNSKVGKNPLNRSYSWALVATTKNPWETEYSHLPPVPFANQPLKMRHIPSVSERPELMNNTAYKGSKVGMGFFERKRSQILKQEGEDGIVHGRSYKTLKELSDIDKLGDQDRQALRQKILVGKKQMLNMYTETLKDKMARFHQSMDSFKVENGAKTHSQMETLNNPPIIY